MYTPTITIAIGSPTPVANGSIYISDVSTDTAILVITTPWTDTATESYLTVGQISNTVKNLSNPVREHRYIVKLLSVVPYTSATFQVLSFAYNGDLLKSPGGTNQLIALDNLSGTGAPNAVINYDYAITNNSSNSILLRWIFATTTNGFAATIKTPEALPPTTYGDINCWYNDWASGNPSCQERTIGAGASYHVTGSITLPLIGQKNFTLGAFVWQDNYWSPGKGEWVAPIGWQSGYTKTVIVDPCIGKICTPDYICQGCSAYHAICNPGNPTGPCIQGTTAYPEKDYLCTSGTFSITSSPSGANVYVNNILQGQTPLSISLPNGTYSVKLSLLNYQDYTNNSVVITCGGTTSLNITMSPRPPVLYDLVVKLKSETTGTYVTNSLQKFATLLNNWLLSKISNISVNSVTYDSTNHRVVAVIEELQTLSGLQPQENVWSIQQSKWLMSQAEWYPTPKIKSLILPILAVEFIMWVAPFIAIIVGWLIANIFFGEHTTVPSHAQLQVNIVEMTNEVAAIPTKDVIVEFNGETKTATAPNYTVTFLNVEIGKTYPIAAYIPLSTDSKVKEASIDCTISPCAINISSDPINYYTAKLRINNIQQRDFKPCNLILDNGNPVPVGTIMRVYNPLTLANGDVTLDPLGSTTIGSDGCAVDAIKVPSNVTDSHLKKQFVAPTFNPNDPSPTLIDGDKNNVPTYSGEKNTISVTVSTTIGGYPIADKIDVINTTTNSIVKSVVPDKYISLITGIPSGTYRISVTMAGYRLSSCAPTTCQVTFTTDYLGSDKVIVVLESIEKTCSLNIYARDNDGKSPKSQVYISVDDKPEVLANEGNLLIPTIVAKSHKFIIKADGYSTITENRTIACADVTEVQIFKTTQTEELPLPESMEMTVNDTKGSIQVEKNVTVIVRIIGGNVGEAVDIKNISTTPDTLLATGTVAGDGTYQTDLLFSSDITFELQAMQQCLLGICSKTSNIVEIKVGKGSPECAIPNPFGGCLVEKTTGYGLMLLAGLGLVGLTMFLRPGGAAERIIERYPPVEKPSIAPKGGK